MHNLQMMHFVEKGLAFYQYAEFVNVRKGVGNVHHPHMSMRDFVLEFEMLLRARDAVTAAVCQCLKQCGSLILHIIEPKETH